MSRSSSVHYGSFDGLRAIAAIGIMLMHYRVNVGDAVRVQLSTDNYLLYGPVISFLTNFVYMFFIVSAFSMCCGYYRKFEVLGDKSSFDTNKFYAKRYARIWPFFALLVGIDFVLNPSWIEFYDCFADLTLAFNLLPNPHISAIGVGWFLGLVFLFYMLFPWFVFLLQSKKRAWFTFAVALAFHLIEMAYYMTTEFCTEDQISAPRHNMVYSFPFFMAGGLLYLYRDRIGDERLKPIWLIMAIAATVAQFVFKPMIFGENVFFVLVIFVLWIMYAITGGYRIGGIKILDNKVMKFLSGLSMEIYLSHMMMFRLLEKLHLENLISNPHLFYWTICVVGFVLTIAFCWLVKHVVFARMSGLSPKLAFLKG